MKNNPFSPEYLFLLSENNVNFICPPDLKTISKLNIDYDCKTSSDNLIIKNLEKKSKVKIKFYQKNHKAKGQRKTSAIAEADFLTII